jgi:hypothetical protein
MGSRLVDEDAREYVRGPRLDPLNVGVCARIGGHGVHMRVQGVAAAVGVGRVDGRRTARGVGL